MSSVSQEAPGTADAAPVPTASAVLLHIVQSIVDDPDAVRINTVVGRHGKTALEVRVGEGDLGRVIGRRGRTAASIRAVVRAAASRDNVDIDIEFED